MSAMILDFRFNDQLCWRKRPEHLNNDGEKQLQQCHRFTVRRSRDTSFFPSHALPVWRRKICRVWSMETVNIHLIVILIRLLIILQSLNFVRKGMANTFSAWCVQSSRMGTVPWNCGIYHYISRRPFTAVMFNAGCLVKCRSFFRTQMQIVWMSC